MRAARPGRSNWTGRQVVDAAVEEQRHAEHGLLARRVRDRGVAVPTPEYLDSSLALNLKIIVLRASGDIREYLKRGV